MKTADLPKHITIARAAKVLGVSRPTVNAMAMRQQIVAEELTPEHWFIVVSSLPKDAQRKLLSGSRPTPEAK